MKKYINCILTWMSHVDIRTAFSNGSALLLGTLPYTFFPFSSPLLPFPLYSQPSAAVVSIHSSLIVCWHWQTSLGVVFQGETRQARYSRPYVSWPRHRASRLPWRGREVKHFKTKQPGIHMPGSENKAGRVNRGGESWAHSVTWFVSKRPATDKTLTSC